MEISSKYLLSSYIEEGRSDLQKQREIFPFLIENTDLFDFLHPVKLSTSLVPDYLKERMPSFIDQVIKVSQTTILNIEFYLFYVPWP